MESTGTYGHRLAGTLVEHGFLVSMVNALQVKRFAQSRAKRAKTDAADAKLLTEYALSLEQCSDERDRLRLWTPDEPSQLFLKQLRTLYEMLVKVRTMLLNQTEALNGYPDVAPMATQTLQSLLKILDIKIAALEEAMNTIVEQHYQHQAKHLESIPGIARKTCVAIIAAIGNIQRFNDAKSLAAFCGLCPRIAESGSSVKAHGTLCYNGNTVIRTQLYMCALSAARYNKPCKELYQRLLAKGKSHKSALLAVAHKLIRQIFAVLKYDTMFQSNPSIGKSLAS
jgi:transposase